MTKQTIVCYIETIFIKVIRVPWTRKQVPDTRAHKCTMLSLVNQGTIKKELSHLSEGRGPLKRDVTIKTLHTQVFLQRIFLGNMQSPFTTTCIYPDMD